MIANLASLAITIAALLFALSLFFGETDAARSLRRAAGFAFVMAFVPSIMVCVFAPVVRNAKFPWGSVQSLLAICGALAILGVFALAAYGFLDFQSRARSRQPRPHSERAAYAKRRPSDRHEERDNDAEEQ
jgi:hypothetical protein